MKLHDVALLPPRGDYSLIKVTYLNLVVVMRPSILFLNVNSRLIHDAQTNGILCDVTSCVRMLW